MSKPIATRQNVLVMEFLGEDGVPYPRMKDSASDDPASALETLLSNVRTLYRDARLIHADLSEYNVLVNPDPILIDFSMSTDLHNPSAEEWLQRDVQNLVRYFRKLGVETREVNELLVEIKGE